MSTSQQPVGPGALVPSVPEGALAVTPVPPARRGPRGGLVDLTSRTLRVRQAQVGLVLVVVILLVAFLGPLFAPHDPAAIIAIPYQPPGGEALLGTDNIGRDVLSRFLSGGSVILLLAFAATVIGVGTGTTLGLIAGYRRGLRGQAIMRALDVLLSFPPVLLALLFMSLLGAKAWLIMVTVAASHVPYVARVVESASLAVTGRGFVQYAEMIGVPRRRILLREILPSVVAPLTVQFGLRMTWSISIIASLAYLGFGRQPPAVDWGMMINENQANLIGAPIPVMLPVLAIAIVTVGANLLTDGFGRAAGINLAAGEAE